MDGGDAMTEEKLNRGVQSELDHLVAQGLLTFEQL